jgi:REP element-mobilizing transposase RayT
MPIKRKINDLDGLFFITFTCWKWIPLFEITPGYDLVYKWFDLLKSHGHQICGYVIMPNHLHAMIHFKEDKKCINKVISNGKRFISYALARRLKEKNRIDLLLDLQAGVTASDQNKGKIHQVFRHSFDWKACRSDRFINQKLNYIHGNPCSGKWKLSPDPGSYLHSSARFYTEGIHSYYPVTHVYDVSVVFRC